MLVMGDEVRRTQAGNNNAYCQDNQISWFDWSQVEKNAELHRFARRLIGLRLSLDVFKEDYGLSLSQLLKLARIRWHGVKLNKPDWSYESRSLAFSVRGRRAIFHIILNAYWEALEFEISSLPRGAKSGWKRIIDTSASSPEDICDWDTAPELANSKCEVGPRSVVVLAVARGL